MRHTIKNITLLIIVPATFMFAITSMLLDANYPTHIALLAPVGLFLSGTYGGFYVAMGFDK